MSKTSPYKMYPGMRVRIKTREEYNKHKVYKQPKFDGTGAYKIDITQLKNFVERIEVLSNTSIFGCYCHILPQVENEKGYYKLDIPLKNNCCFFEEELVSDIDEMLKELL